MGHRATLILTLLLVACGGDEESGSTPVADVGTDVIEEVGDDVSAPDAPPDVEPDTPPGNLPPVAAAGPDQQVDALTMVSLDGSASSDPEGARLTYIWTQEQGQTVRFDTASATPTFMAPANTTEIILALVVSDGDKLSVPDRVTIRVQGPNRAPVADAGPDRTALIDDVVNLDGGRSRDPDEGDEITFAWRQTGGPSVQINDPLSPEPRFRTDGFVGESTLVFTLVVSDGELASAPSDVAVTVRNRRPIADAGRDGVVLQEGEFVLDGAASADPDGDEITYRWSQVGGLPVELTPAGSASPSFVAPMLAGPVEFQLIVHDGETESAADRVTVFAVGDGWQDRDGDALRDESEAEVGTDADNPDTDGDGIPDGWEALGHEGIDYRSLGASPLHRDLLLEVDYQGEPLPAEVVDALVAAFAALPVDNPDGVPGIALHVVHDAELAPNFQCFYPGDGQAGDRTTLHRLHLDTFHKLQVCIGDDVRLAARRDRSLVVQAPPATDDVSRGRLVLTILRGLGFDLGLSVGGGDDLDFKPNYPSVMNTAYAVTGPGSFSTGVLPSLDECALVEVAPFGEAPVDTLGFLELYLGMDWSADDAGNVDWNGNDTIDDTPYELILRPGGAMCETLMDFSDGGRMSDELAQSLNVRELRRD